MSSVSPLYELDNIKQVLDEVGIEANEDKITEFARRAQGEVNVLLTYIFEDTDFPLQESDFTAAGFTADQFKALRKIINAICIGHFWVDTNDTTKSLEEARKELTEFREMLFHQPPATTL